MIAKPENDAGEPPADSAATLRAHLGAVADGMQLLALMVEKNRRDQARSVASLRVDLRRLEEILAAANT